MAAVFVNYLRWQEWPSPKRYGALTRNPSTSALWKMLRGIQIHSGNGMRARILRSYWKNADLLMISTPAESTCSLSEKTLESMKCPFPKGNAHHCFPALRAVLSSPEMVSRYCMLLPLEEKSLFTVSLGRRAKSSGHPRSR